MNYRLRRRKNPLVINDVRFHVGKIPRKTRVTFAGFRFPRIGTYRIYRYRIEEISFVQFRKFVTRWRCASTLHSRVRPHVRCTFGSAVCRNLEYSIHRRADRAFAPTHAYARVRVSERKPRDSRSADSRLYLRVATTSAPGVLAPKNALQVMPRALLICQNTYLAYVSWQVTQVLFSLFFFFFRLDPSRIPVSSRASCKVPSEFAFRLAPRLGRPNGARNSPARLLQNYSKNWFPPF